MLSIKAGCAIRNGIVKRIEGDRIVVGIERAEACGTCGARSVCGMHGSEVHEVEVAQPEQSVRVGDRVTLSIPDREGFRALLVAYMLPFVLVMVALGVLISLGAQEWLAGVVSIGLVGVYYAVLYWFRSRWTSKASIKDVQKES